MEAQIAKWLHDKVMTENWVTQSDAVREIEERFGKEYTYTNVNGNPAIILGVLKEFGKLKGDNIIWDRSSREWRVKTDADRELERIEAELPKIESFKIDIPKIDAELPKFDSDILGDFDTNIK